MTYFVLQIHSRYNSVYDTKIRWGSDKISWLGRLSIQLCDISHRILQNTTVMYRIMLSPYSLVWSSVQTEINFLVVLIFILVRSASFLVIVPFTTCHLFTTVLFLLQVFGRISNWPPTNTIVFMTCFTLDSLNPQSYNNQFSKICCYSFRKTVKLNFSFGNFEFF